MKTSTTNNPMTKSMSISDKALAAIATLGAIGTLACGIVAFSGAVAPDAGDEIATTHACEALRPNPIASPVWETLAAIGQSVLSYSAAVHSTSELGPMRIAVDGGNAVLIDVGAFGRQIGTIRIDAGLCKLRPASGTSDVSIEPELAFASHAQSLASFRLVSDLAEPKAPEEPVLTHAARWTRDGYCPAWPDSAEYAAPIGKRVFLDDAPITDPTVLVGEAASSDASIDA
jgi:hypothetical protein